MARADFRFDGCTTDWCANGPNTSWRGITGRYGSLEALIGAGLLDASFRGVKAGFNYSVIASGSDYAAAAIPANSATGRYGFYAVPDAVVRYSTVESLAPPQQSGRPVQ